jgi:hypothetical protein
MRSIQKSEGLFGLAVVLLAATLSNAAVDTVRVNCGGSAYTAANGRLWAADSGFVGGTVYAPNNPPTLTGTADPALHQVERYGDAVDFSYHFNLTPGSDRVYLWNATLWDGACGEGTRVVDVTINGTKVLTNYDMSAEVPCLTAHAKNFAVTTTTGSINITFNVGAVQNPKINAIEIVPLAGSSIHGASKANASKFTMSASNGALTVLSQVEGAYSLELKDLQGKRIDSKTGSGSGSQSFSNLRPGVYFLTTVSGSESVTRKFSVLR